MSKIAFIFPGQGAQACGMGKDFYEQTETGKRIFDKATQLMGFSMPQLCFEENDRLDITEYTQAPTVTVFWKKMEASRMWRRDSALENTAPWQRPESWVMRMPSGRSARGEYLCRRLYLWARAPWQPFWPWTRQ